MWSYLVPSMLLQMAVFYSFLWLSNIPLWVSQVALVVENPSANAGDIRNQGSIPRLGRSPGGEHGNPLQYCCLENPMDKAAWQATVHRVAKSWTQLKWLSMQYSIVDMYYMSFLSVYLLMDILVVSMSWLLYIVLLWM